MQIDSLVTPAFREELFSRLDALAAKLGVGAEYLWEVLISQAGVRVIQNLMIIAFVLVCVVVWSVCFRHLVAQEDENHWGWGPTILLGLLLVIGAVGAGVLAWELPGLILNPEYWAFQQILEAF